MIRSNECCSSEHRRLATLQALCHKSLIACFLALLGLAAVPPARSAPAQLLFEDDFNRGIPGWTAVQPAYTYTDGPMRWQYDIVSGAFLEQSNIYTDAAGGGPGNTGTAVMLINDAITGTNYTYKARLIAGDDDAFGLIFGYGDSNNFYRVTFTRQVRAAVGFPWNGWNVDRRVNNVSTPLFGDGTPDHVPSFVNTQYLPFDVTISVTGDNLFSLTVVDDPDNAPVEHKLVENKPLPSAAAGKVGMYTWGQSGSALRAFRIFNLSLAPGGIAGNPNALANWTTVVPPRADGTGLDPASGNGGRPIWSLALGQNGAFGTLHENSDSFGGNTDTGTIDFSAPSIVAGDAAWTNYLMSARIIPADDDGHGILLRYLNETNFYRISLRAQTSTTGPPEGLAIQKVVNGVWEEIYRDNPVQFDPPNNVPYDISALVIGNRLQVRVIANPAGAAQIFNYGPFDLAGETVPRGKAGFFSWGMSRLEVDWVRVHQIDGTPLEVVSAYGSPSPAAGLHGFTAGSSVTASVGSPVEESPGLRRRSTGWKGGGSVPATGAGTNVTFTLNEISSLTWNWVTEVKLSASAGIGGQVAGPSGEWFPQGTNVTLTAQANPGYVFVGWAGDVTAIDRTLNLTLARPYNITARFAVDANNDGVPDQLLFEDDFNRGIPGWTAVQPPYNYTEGPMRWQYDIVSGAFLEQSNIYTDAAGGSPTNSGTAVMLINDTVAGSNFTYKARLIAGDDDAFGLIFGYQNSNNFYRVTFTRQNRTSPGFPYNGWSVDRRVDNVSTVLFGDGSPNHTPSFTNTQYRPFEVTINVSGADSFSLTVVDDPDGARREFKLVESKPLPGPAGGKVGMYTWGQAGTALRGFRILNPELSPLALAGNPNALPNWTPVIPPRADGSGLDPTSGNGGRPIWSVALGQNGPFGTLHENSDAFGGNVSGPGNIDFSAPSIVAGDVAWSNYVMTARIIPADDDGHGILLRYQNETNFYRVSLRSQTSTNGPLEGLSIQKVVNGAWEEVYRDNPVKFDPPNNVPYDITALVLNDLLQVRIVANPNGTSPQIYNYGPFNLTGATLSSGKIGFFSWGMSRAEFDFVRVTSMNGIPLTVNSEFGSPAPAVGQQGFDRGSSVTASIGSPIDAGVGHRLRVTGWTGDGSVPATGTGTNVTFTINEMSSITWQWVTEFNLQASAGLGGQVTASASGWLPSGTNVTVTAQPGPGFVFANWSGNITSTNQVLNLTMTQPYSIQANFGTDFDNDGLPDPVIFEDDFNRGIPGWFAVQPPYTYTDGPMRWQFDAVSNAFLEQSNIYTDAAGGSLNNSGTAVMLINQAAAGTNFTYKARLTAGDDDAFGLIFGYQNPSNFFRVNFTRQNRTTPGFPWNGWNVEHRVNNVSTTLFGDGTPEHVPSFINTQYLPFDVTITVTGANVLTLTVVDDPVNAPISYPLVDAKPLPAPAGGNVGMYTWGQSGSLLRGFRIENPALTPVSLVGNPNALTNWTPVVTLRNDGSGLDPASPNGGRGIWSLALGLTNPATWETGPLGTLHENSDSHDGNLPGTEIDFAASSLVAGDPAWSNYVVTARLIPRDNDGHGLLLRYQNETNFIRVTMRSEAAASGPVRGLSIQKVVNGVWQEVYRETTVKYDPINNAPYDISAIVQNAKLEVRIVGNPGTPTAQEHTYGPFDIAAPVPASGKIGFFSWGMTRFEVDSVRVSQLGRAAPGELRITKIALSGGNVILDVSNPSGGAYTVEKSDTLLPGSWSAAASGLTAAQWSAPAQTTPGTVFYRLRR